MSEPKEAFPWKPSKTFDDSIVDANDDHVLELVGWRGRGGSMEAPGIAERRRMILEIPAMLKVVDRVAKMPDALGIKEAAQAILARIEGKPDA